MSSSSQTGREAERVLLTSLLRDVSRSFYLTLRILPKPIRSQIGLAYLLARATDTIADTDAVSVEERLTALRGLRARILGETQDRFELPRLQEHQSLPAERVLLQRVNEALAILQQFGENDRELIRRVLGIISEGQELDLVRFGNASAEKIAALGADAELDDYTYRVAGCVGEFWTQICFAHLKPRPGASLELMVERGIRFGKGLQLVNILRDLPRDLRNGRCYLPSPALQLVGLRPGDLLDPANHSKLRPVYDRWVGIAEEHLTVAWQYVLALPRTWWRVRLACAWPVLIGLKTLEKLNHSNVLNSDTRIKVSRPELKSILRRSILLYPFASSWQNLPGRIRTRG